MVKKRKISIRNPKPQTPKKIKNLNKFKKNNNKMKTQVILTVITILIKSTLTECSGNYSNEIPIIGGCGSQAKVDNMGGPGYCCRVITCDKINTDLDTYEDFVTKDVVNGGCENGLTVQKMHWNVNLLDKKNIEIFCCSNFTGRRIII